MPGAKIMDMDKMVDSKIIEEELKTSGGFIEFLYLRFKRVSLSKNYGHIMRTRDKGRLSRRGWSPYSMSSRHRGAVNKNVKIQKLFFTKLIIFTG